MDSPHLEQLLLIDGDPHRVERGHHGVHDGHQRDDIAALGGQEVAQLGHHDARHDQERPRKLERGHVPPSRQPIRGRLVSQPISRRYHYLRPNL